MNPKKSSSVPYGVDRKLSNLISKCLNRYTNISAQDFAKLLHLAGEDQINELQATRHDWLADNASRERGLREEGIIVLGIARSDRNYLGMPDGDTSMLKNDVLILYGRANVMQELDQRKSDSAGNREHREKIADQKKSKRKARDQE